VNGNNVSGETHILFGSATAFSGTISASTLNGTNGFTLEGTAALDRSGWSIAAIGDINNDTIDDILVGAPRAENGALIDAGAAYVIFGKTTGFAATINFGTMTAAEGFTIPGLAAFDEAGLAVGSAGDINSDGIDDMVISAHMADLGANTNEGKAYVIFGGNASFGTATTFDLSTLNGTNGFVIEGGATFDNLASSFASVGDINGDTYDDLLIGAEDAGVGTTGASYVIYGIPNTSTFAATLNVNALNGTNGFAMVGVSDFDDFGASVSSAGDINGDGINDMLIGAPTADPNGLSSAGETYLVFGKSTSGFGASFDLSTLDGTDGYVFNGIASIDRSGGSVSGAGDLNGDGVDDLVIGAYFANSISGETYVVHGGADNLTFFDAADGSVDGQIDLVGLQQIPEFI
jgi:hypothetical protein